MTFEVGRYRHFQPPPRGFVIHGLLCGAGDTGLGRPYPGAVPGLRSCINHGLYQVAGHYGLFPLCHILPLSLAPQFWRGYLEKRKSPPSAGKR